MTGNFAPKKSQPTTTATVHEIGCPHCGSISDLPADRAGKRLRCEFCKRPFVFVVRPAGDEGVSNIEVRKSLSQKAEQKAVARKAKQQAAIDRKRKLVIGVSISGACVFAAIALIAFLVYRNATSYETRLKQLASDHQSNVEAAKQALQHAGADAVPYLIKGLKGDSAQAREHCLLILEKLGK